MTATSAGDIDALAKEISEIAQAHDLTRRVTITGTRSEVRIAVAMNQLLDGLGAREKHLRTMMDSMKDATDDAQTANKLLKRVKDELKSRKVQLADAVAKASAANTAKSQFLANMSHEIRTPMNGILGTAELLARTPLEGKQERYVGTILRSGRALLTIINDILDFSKVESGKIELSDAPFDLVVCISDVIALLTPTCTAKNIELHLVLEPDLPHSYLGDVGRIRQILTNIIGNSVKFTDEGAVTVTLTGHNVDGKVGLRFEVRDTGIGIPVNKVNDVFEKFSQVDNTSARRHEGTGLGLAICKRLIELMGGQVGVESVAGEGSTFWCTLPLIEPPVEPLLEPSIVPLNAPRVAAERPVSLGLTVLVAEDGIVNQMLIMRMLANMGCQADLAVNGQEAVERYSHKRYDVILMDCHMPEMDGFQATVAIRKMEIQLAHDTQHPVARIPIVAVTASAFVEDREACAQAGMDDFCMKPYGTHDLRAALERWMPATEQAV